MSGCFVRIRHAQNQWDLGCVQKGLKDVPGCKDEKDLPLVTVGYGASLINERFDGVCTNDLIGSSLQRSSVAKNVPIFRPDDKT